jgi:suppressor for copper-sensitivity B
MSLHPTHLRAVGILSWILFLLTAPKVWAQASDPVSVEVVPARASAAPGENLAVAVVFDIEDGWHLHTNDPKIPESWGKFPAIPTRIVVKSSSGAQVGPLQWPAPSIIKLDLAGTGKPERYGVFEGRSIAYVPLIIKPDASGTANLDIEVSFQVCNDNLCLPEQTIPGKAQIKIEPSGGGAVPPSGSGDLFKGFDNSVFARMQQGAAYHATASFDFFGWKFNLNADAYWLILLIAFIAGFLLNLTPCVLPVVPLKVLSLQKQAGNPAKLALYGTVYCVGIIATFFVLGLLIFGLVTGGQKQDWGQIFASAPFTITMAAIVGIMGLGLMGLFTFKLPQAVYLLSPTSDSVTGNFLMGVLTAILSTPCTGPLLGATIAWAVTQPAWLGLATMTVMGLGMAAPYGLLIAFPALMNKLPKAGPGGELLKQVLGIILIAVAAFLASNLTISRWTWWVVGGLLAVACLWAIVGAWRMLRTQRGKLTVTAVSALALVGVALMTVSLADEGPIPWKVFANKKNEAIFDEIKKATADNKTVVVDFTAKWCTNCHVIEKTVLTSEDGVRLLKTTDVLLIKVDLTRAKPDTGWGAVNQISGGGGIPLIAVYRPGEPTPVYFNSFFKLSDLAKAMGRQVASASPAPVPKP